MKEAIQLKQKGHETSAEPATGLLQGFATCPQGMQEALAQEMLTAQAEDIKTTSGGVFFQGDLACIYRANLSSRLASRILVKLEQGRYRSDKDIYKIAGRVDWSEHMDVQQTLRIDTRAVRSNLRSLNIVSLRAKDAIVDQFRDNTGERPNVDTHDPDVRIVIFLDERYASIYIDTSGQSLFKRGWRTSDDKGAAPIKENLAAGLLRLSGWTPGNTLLDPFCGSGTIAIEAAQMETDTAAGMRRQFALQVHPGFDAELWRKIKSGYRKQEHRPSAAILASDIDVDMIRVSKMNAGEAGLNRAAISLQACDFLNCRPPEGKTGFIVSNPPYGERLSVADPAQFWRDAGAHLRHHFAGWTVALISADLKLPGKLGLKPARKIPLYNGPLDCRLFIFKMRTDSERPVRPDDEQN